MKKKALMNIVAVVAILMCALPVFSAGQQEAAGDEIQVTFMVHDLGNPFWATQAKGATDKAKELGVKLTVIDLQVDAAKEISTWENLITAKVDGIMISCVDEEASKAYCQKAQA